MSLIVSVRGLHYTFDDGTEALRGVDSPLPELHSELAQLGVDEARIFALLPGRAPADQQLTLQLFSQLYRGTQRLLTQSQTLVTRYANQPPAAALDVQRTLLKQIALVLPLAVLLAAVLLRVITRPIRNVEGAIQQLGRGELDTRRNDTCNAFGQEFWGDIGNGIC